jgi:hypothetical protein
MSPVWQEVSRLNYVRYVEQSAIEPCQAVVHNAGLTERPIKQIRLRLLRHLQSQKLPGLEAGAGIEPANRATSRQKSHLS